MKIRILPIGLYQENTYVVHEEGHVLIVDPGGHPEIITKEIGSEETVEAVILTHGHEDHVGAVDPIVARFHCPVYLHRNDLGLVDPMQYRNHAFACGLTSKITPMGSTIDVPGFHLDVLETPGHTLGSVCVLLQDVMFSGDTLFYGSIGRTDLSDSDPQLMRTSLQKLMAVKKNYHVLPGHGPATTLDQEKQTNPYLSGRYCI